MYCRIQVAVCEESSTEKNYLIKLTLTSTLDNAGFEGCHITQLSSHKSKPTIKEYLTKCPENKRKGFPT